MKRALPGHIAEDVGGGAHGHDGGRRDIEDRLGSGDESVLTSALWNHQRERWRLAVEYLADEVEAQLQGK